MTNNKPKHKFMKAAASGALVVSSISTIAVPISAAQFSDIENSSHKDSIEQLLQREIIKGYSDGTFKPNKPVTRGQAAKMIASVLNLELSHVPNPNFSDIPEDNEFYPYIAALANKGIISGYADDTFKQNRTITRGQMAKMLAIGFSLTAEKSHPFTDVSNKSEYATYITALFENDVTTGTSNTTFSPRNHVTRGQLASFIIRAEKILPVSSQVSGSITAVTTNSITVDGNKYTLENRDLLATDKNRAALLNSTITFEAVNSSIANISRLQLHKGATGFNGANVKIDELILPASIEQLINVNAESVTVEKVAPIASIKKIVVTNAASLTITNSTIEKLVVSGATNLTNNESNISLVDALTVQTLQLNGLFNTILVDVATTIDGNATIQTLLGPDEQQANIIISPTISINNVKIGNHTYTLQQVLQRFGYTFSNENKDSEDDSKNDEEAPNTGVIPGGDNPSDDEDKPSVDNPSKDEDKPNVDNPSKDEDKPNVDNPSKDEDKPNVDNPSKDEDKPNVDNPSKDDTPPASKPVEVSGGTIVDFDKNEIVVDGQTLSLSEEQATTISSFVDTITNLTVTSDENGKAIIENITLLAQQQFDGAELVDVKEVTILGNVSSISNVQADVLNVEASSSLTFDNVTANIVAAGSFNSISGASGDQITIASTARYVEVSNVSSKNVVIKESARPAVTARAITASLRPMLATLASNSTTTMTLIFSEGDYNGQTLKVERKDTLVDLRSNPFSKITITNNDVEIKSVSAVDAIVANNITNLRLYADVNSLDLNLEDPVSIAGGGSKIDTLIMTTTASNTNGWVDLIDVTPRLIKLNEQEITKTHDIFKKYAAEHFASSLSLSPDSTFGYYTINADYDKSTQSLKYVLLKEDEPINTTSVPTHAKDYTDKFIPYADYPKIVVYKIENNTLKGYSVPEAPTAAPITVTNGIDAPNKKITFTTRYSDDISPQQAIKYFFVFKATGEPEILSTFNGFWTKVNGLNTYTADTNANLNGNSLFVANKLVVASGFTIPNNPDVYINGLKSIATYANNLEPKQPEMIYDILKRIASNSTVPFDSSFLSLYVEAIVNNPSNYSTKAQLESLLTKVQQENQYDATHIKTAADLYLTGKINTTFSYSNQGIVTNKLSDNGELLTIPKAAGNTTLKVTDSNGNATLVNITVDASKQITDFEIVEAPITGNEVLNGTSDFRIFTKGTSKILLPINLKNTVAVIKDGSSFYRYTVSLADSLYNLTAEEITPYISPVQQFGFDDITTVSSTKVGRYESNDGNLMLYPIYAGSETIYVGDVNNTTAVHVEVDTDIKVTIAKSEDTLTIATDLQLQSAKTVELMPANAKVHLYNNGTEIRAFAKDAAKASYTIKDQANNVTLVNVTATKTNNVLAVNKFEVVKEQLTLNAGVTVQAVSNTIVRVVNNELYALATGTTTVTLSNGDQYEVTIGYTDSQYSMEVEKVTNLLLNAADLQMTNITTVETTNSAVSTHKIANNSQLAVTLNSDTTATMTLVSSNNEKTVVHVTKAGTQYEYTVDRVEITRQQLGLNTLTDATGNAVDILPARAKVSANGDSVFIYNFEVGNRSFYITDGTNSTAVNVTVTSNGAKYTSTPEVVKHEIPAHLTIVNNATITSSAAHLEGNVLYATGLVKDESTISVPLANGANYVVKVRFNPETGLYSFDSTGTITYNQSINKSTLGLDTISNATPVANSNTEAVVVGDDVLVSITKDTDTRIQVNGANGADLTAKAYIYVKREDTNTAAPVDVTVERTIDAIDLTTYGYNAAPIALWSHAGIARAHIKNDLKVDFYALALGTARYELGSADKKLLVNVNVTGANKRTVSATVVKKALTQAGTIIAGDGVRLSANKQTVYATKEDVKTIVRLADNTIVEYNVTIDENGHYKLNETILPATNTHTITAASLSLSGTITATGLNTNVVTQLPFENTITLSAIAAGTTSLIVQDENSDKAIVNVTVDVDKKITVSAPIKVEATDTPTLLHDEDKAIVRINEKELIAIGEGTAEILVGNKVQQVTVTNTNGHYAISTPETISKAVYTASDLGFAANAAMTIEDGYDREKFYIANMDGKIVAYSKLTGSTTGATEFVVKATGTNLRTLVRLNDKGAVLLEQKIAKDAASLTGTVTVVDTAIARFNDGELYSFKEGFTHLFENGRMKAIDVTRDTNDDLQASVRPLEVEATGTEFKAIANTDSNILEISTNKKTLYAKGFGQTQVQDGDKIYTIKVEKDANNKVTMTSTEVSTKFVAVGEAGLTKFTDVTLVHGTANALSYNRDENSGLTIYNNSGVKSETFAVKVTDGTHDAIINVTVNDAGIITRAEVAKVEIKEVQISATQTLQTATARAVWDNNKITIYPLEQGNTAFKFTNGLVNAQIIKTANTLVPAAQLLQHVFTSALNTVTNGSIVKTVNDDKSIYPISEGTALAYTNDKLHTITVAKANDQYTLNVSNGVAFTTLDLTVAGGTYAVNDSVLNGVAAIVNEDTAENKLVIYKEGTGVSDIVITNAADEKSIYHVTASNNEVKTPVLAITTLTGDMIGAGSLEGTSIRQKDNLLYLLATGNASLKATDNRLINVQVTRDENTKYLTASPTFASTTLKEVPTTLTNYTIDSNTAYAKNGIATETFVTTNYRTTLKTVKNGQIYEVNADERQAKQFEFATYGISSTIKEVDNTVQNVAEAEERDGKLVIYEGTVDGTTILTIEDNNNKTVKFKVTRNNNGEVFTVTPLVAVESVKFEDIGLDGTTEAITATVYDSSVATVTATATGLNILAQQQGLTSIELTQNNKIVGIINVKVDTDSKVTSTPIKLTTTGDILHNTMTVEPRTSAKGTYVNAPGTVLFKTVTNKATIVRVSKNTDSGYYSVETSEHALSIIPKANLGLSNISSVALTGSSVGTFTKSDGSELYIYGTNNGITDVVVTEKVSDTEMKQATIVANNSSDLVTTIAKENIDADNKIDAADLAAATWTSNLVEIRDNVIYATKSGTGTATSRVNGHDVLMNVSVTRNPSSVYVISHEIVAKNYSSTPTVLIGESVIADGTRIYAQKVGTSTVQIDNQIYTVNVTKSSDGLYTIDVSEPVVQQTYTAAQLGLTSISKYTISAITGAGVVAAQVLNNDKIIIYAKTAGQAEVTVEGAEGKTLIHALVADTSNGLTLDPTIAKKTVENASTLVDNSNTFRAYGNELFVLKAGHIVTHINGQLHNLKASLVNNVYDISATRIEKNMGATPTLSTNETILVAEGNKIVAVDFGETNITVGSNAYRVKVNNDGTMQTELLVAEKIDVAEALSSVTSVSTSTIATITHSGTELTIKPLAEGTEIIEVTDGNATVQVEVKVERISAGENGLVVTSKLISNSYDVGVIGFYPSGIETVGFQTYRSQQGVLKIESNGVVTLYPGKSGTSHVVIKGTAKQAIYDLTVANDYKYSFKPFTTIVTYSEFTAYPTVIDQSGNASAKQSNNGIEVTFVDTNETVFLLKGESDYKTLLVKVEKENGLYTVKKSVVGAPVVVNGDVTNVVGNLRTKKDGDNTIIYADSSSTTPASYTANSTLYKASIVDNYALTVNKVTLNTNFTTATHLEENDVVAIVDGKWQAIQEGTGIYSVDNDYVKVDVDLTKDAPITVTTLSKLVLTSSSITLMDSYNGLYLDDKTIYGSYPIEQPFIAKVDGILYKGSFKDNLTAIKLDLLTELGWTSYKSHNLTSDNIVKIVNNELIATGKGTLNIEFVSPTGLKKTLAVTVDDNYALSANGNDVINIITYTDILNEIDYEEYSFTFSFNLNIDNLDLTKVSGIRSEVAHNKNIIMLKSSISTAESVFKIVLPELASNSNQTFTISLTSDDNHSITTASPTLQFNRVTPTN